ncbi:flagellar hook-basal body protein [Kurthia sibirica]|uniref:Flagellar hook-basal body protein n=1 Tax=Kurthia sibirica TaxID=202750 RepID=A0A2U3AKY2_9BACL|nr:flagellar hook-basal body protein [Kurthia sibirica]PWI25193.1 flagellar hook-basal body protein [Kurthia sibirica]GEK33280.1 flagellar hook-basal body complex protein FlhP [Kurthia sibirica]
MLRTMLSATNTMSQLQNKLDTISNNIANSNTTGFQARNATFGELLYQQFDNDVKDKAPRQSPAGIRIGVGAQIAQTQLNTKVGSMQQTKRALDFALTKENQYFAVNNEGQLLLTRQGNFYLSPTTGNNTELVNAEGYKVSDVNGNDITFNKAVSSITTTQEGIMNVTYADNTTAQRQLAVVQVDKPQLLKNDNGQYLRYADDIAQGFPNENDIAHIMTNNERTNIAVESGVLESSNVDLSKEMSELINAQRSYQFNARTITMADQMLGLINSVR